MMWSKEKIIEELRSINKKLGHSPSSREIPNLCVAAQNYFGSFNKAKSAAGLKINKLKHSHVKASACKISKEFAYILGVVYGDGFTGLIRNSHGTSAYVGLKVRDKDFALIFKNLLERWSGLKAKSSFDKRKFYNTYLYSVDAIMIIRNIELYKILKWKKEFQYEFLKGLFDSDGGIIGHNLNDRRNAKRWLHFSNNNRKLIFIVKEVLKRMGIKYSVIGRISSGFGSKKIQYQINIYSLKDIFKYYKYIGFNIKRKQDKLKEVIGSYSFYSTEQFKKAKELHKKMGFRKVAKELELPHNVVYKWLFKDYKDKILDFGGTEWLKR